MRNVIREVAAGCIIGCIMGCIIGGVYIVSINRASPKVKGWETFVVTEPNTRVWCLARRCDPKGDPRIALELIVEKNPWVREVNYDIRLGDEILLPIIDQ